MVIRIHIHKRTRDTLPSIVTERLKKILGPDADKASQIVANLNLNTRIINRKFNIPYLAGSNEKGGITYIDKSLPQQIKVYNKVFDPAKYLNIHEQVERALMEQMNLPYIKAHSIAEEYERAALEKDGIDWMQYERTLNGYINETEHKTKLSIPSDLYMKPYPKTLCRKLKHD